MTAKARLAIQAKIFGVMLQDARQLTGKTLNECAEVLGVSSRVYRSYELGKKAISLPELEVLAYYLNMPLSRFWDGDIVSDDADARMEVNVTAMLPIRHKLVGARLRAAREGQHITAKEMAEVVGITTRRLSLYELGEMPIPITELELMCNRLGLRVADFVEADGPLAQFELRRQAQAQVGKMTPEMQQFIGNPSNLPFIELAMRLSTMNVNRLRTVAESLLEITF